MDTAPAKFWYFKSVLTPRFCDEVIRLGLSQKEEIARTGGFDDKKLTKEQLRFMKNTRNCNVVWLNDNWIYKEVHPYVRAANKNAGWNYSWDFSESCQFTKYKLNQYYDWHSDSWENAYGEEEKNKNYVGKIRKLSVTCQLTDESEYVGGELEFQFRNKDDPTLTVEATEAKRKGTIIVFPSHVWHRVKPVTSGNRYSLVIWSLGKPFI